MEMNGKRIVLLCRKVGLLDNPCMLACLFRRAIRLDDRCDLFRRTMRLDDRCVGVGVVY